MPDLSKHLLPWKRIELFECKEPTYARSGLTHAIGTYICRIFILTQEKHTTYTYYDWFSDGVMIERQHISSDLSEIMRLADETLQRNGFTLLSEEEANKLLVLL